MFITDITNDYGLYAVSLVKNGEVKEVVIDDYFPCLDGSPCFSKANGNELWVLILEKCWAKLHGSYERIEAGHAHNVMTDLTGAPSIDLDIEQEGPEAIWDKLLQGERKNYLMAASAGTTNSSADLLESLGLVAEHSYGLLKVCEVTDENGQRIRLCLLRNPWGAFEWNGDWSDNSEMWTPEIKR
jgi:calpain-15